MRIITLHEAQNLILSLKTIREPEKQHQYYLQMKIEESYRDWFKKWLLSNCTKNGKEYQNEILRLLEQIHDSISKED